MDGQEQTQTAQPAQTTTQVQTAESGANSQSLGWRAGLPKEYQNHEAFGKYGKVGDLAKDFLELRNRTQRPSLPGDDSPDEERQAFYKAFGRPDQANGYSIEGMEGVDPNHPGIQQLMAVAHESGMSQKQFERVFGHLVQQGSEATKAQQQAMKAALQDADKGLRDDWKDQYPAKREYAMRGYKQLDDQTRKSLEKSGVINQPWFIKMMAQAGESTAEGRFIRGGTQGATQRAFMVDYNQE